MDYPENLGILGGRLVDVSGETKKKFESLDASISEKFYHEIYRHLRNCQNSLINRIFLVKLF